MHDNHYLKDACLVDFVNGREDRVFTPAQLKDQLKVVCGAEKQDNFVRDWLDQRLNRKEIRRLNQGIYRREKTLESKMDYVRRCIGLNVDSVEI